MKNYQLMMVLLYMCIILKEKDNGGSNVITLTENTKLAYIYWNLYEYCAIPLFRSVDKVGKPGKVWNLPNHIIELRYEVCDCAPYEAKKILAKTKSKSKVKLTVYN